MKILVKCNSVIWASYRLQYVEKTVCQVACKKLQEQAITNCRKVKNGYNRLQATRSFSN